MKKLSFAASAAWQISAQEAAAREYALIEVDHLLVGILSLEKIGTAKDLDPLSQEALHEETMGVKEVVGHSGSIRLYFDIPCARSWGKGMAGHPRRPFTAARYARRSFSALAN